MFIVSSSEIFYNYFRWREEKYHEDPTLFCRMALEQNDLLCSSYPIWIISDIRNHGEIEFFKKYFNDCLLLVRIEASNDIREKRGWNCQIDIDNLEDQLDTNVQWSFIFSNNDEDTFNEQMNSLIKIIQS
jgi:phosphomevalonate kinase